MTNPDVNLYYLHISVPAGYKEGEPTGYNDISIGEILDKQDAFELIILQDWITDQFLRKIDWDLAKPITTQIVANALVVFKQLGIEPKPFIYIDPNFKKGNK